MAPACPSLPPAFSPVNDEDAWEELEAKVTSRAFSQELGGMHAWPQPGFRPDTKVAQDFLEGHRIQTEYVHSQAWDLLRTHTGWPGRPARGLVLWGSPPVQAEASSLCPSWA